MPSRSSEEQQEYAAALEAALERLRDAVRVLAAPRARVLIDGRSGAGKTTIARRLRDSWPGDGVPRLVGMDEFYPGWDGLASAGDTVGAEILAPLADGRRGAYRRWDWAADAPGERVLVEPTDPLILEGAGALTPRSRPLADLAVWVDAPERNRRSRALARDGETYAPHWERWAAQERAHIASHDPAALADLRLELR